MNTKRGTLITPRVCRVAKTYTCHLGSLCFGHPAFAVPRPGGVSGVLNKQNHIRHISSTSHDPLTGLVHPPPTAQVASICTPSTLQAQHSPSPSFF